MTRVSPFWDKEVAVFRFCSSHVEGNSTLGRLTCAFLKAYFLGEHKPVRCMEFRSKALPLHVPRDFSVNPRPLSVGWGIARARTDLSEHLVGLCQQIRKVGELGGPCLQAFDVYKSQPLL